MNSKAKFFLAAAAFCAAGPVFGLPIAADNPGASLFVSSTDPVIATYLGNTASFSNDLFLVVDGIDDVFLFNNQTSPVGTTVDLGSFAVGTELVFRLSVEDTGNDFFTGPASRNPDGQAHATVEEDYLVDGTTLVSFEDLFNGPFDFNDLSFSFSNTTLVSPTPVPLPPALPMLALALLPLGFFRRKV